MHRGRTALRSLARNRILLGTVTVLVLAVAVLISYNANSGSPFVATYRVYADLPDAAELTKGDGVRIAGSRVGDIVSIDAMPARGHRRAYARLELHLDTSVEPLPADTRTKVRLGSVLGAEFLELRPGHARRTIPPGGDIPPANVISTTQLSQAFAIFAQPTAREIQHLVVGAGNALAGRGGALNGTIGALAGLLGPLGHLGGVLADPATNLGGFIDGLQRAMAALAPDAATLGDLIDRASATLGALDAAGGALGAAIRAIPPLEATGTADLHGIAPVLSDAAVLARALRPGVRSIPRTARRIDTALRTGTPVLRRTGLLIRPLGTALTRLDGLSRDPASAVSLDQLSAALTALRPALRLLGSAQEHCNVVGIYTRNFASAFSEGDTDSNWLRFLLVADPTQILQAGRPAQDLHVDPYPTENAGACQAGNEPYAPGRQIGHPAPTANTHTASTHPPPGVPERAARAGLLTLPRGAR